MALTKQGNFSQQPSELPDVPSPSMTPDQIRAKWQTPLDELKTTMNNAINKLNSTTDGDSGADNIGATGFGGTPSTPQAMLEDLNTRKAEKGGDWTGTWQGYTPSKADPGISSVVEQHTAQLADISTNIKNLVQVPESDYSGAFQRAIDNGGKILVPDGIYIVDGSVLGYQKNNIFIIGAIGKSIIQLKNNSQPNQYHVSLLFRECNNISIFGLVFLGNNKENTDLVQANEYLEVACKIEGCEDVSIDHCVFQYINYGVDTWYIDSYNQWHVIGSTSDYKMTKRVKVTKCSFLNMPKGISAGYGVNISPAEDSKVVDCFFFNCGRHAVYLRRGAINCIVEDNTIGTCGASAINIYSSDETGYKPNPTATGNIIRNNKIANSSVTEDAINITGHAEDNIIEFNTIENALNNGIVLDSYATKNKIRYNTIKTVTNSPIYVRSSTTKGNEIYGNKIYKTVSQKGILDNGANLEYDNEFINTDAGSIPIKQNLTLQNTNGNLFDWTLGINNYPTGWGGNNIAVPTKSTDTPDESLLYSIEINDSSTSYPGEVNLPVIPDSAISGRTIMVEFWVKKVSGTNNKIAYHLKRQTSGAFVSNLFSITDTSLTIGEWNKIQMKAKIPVDSGNETLLRIQPTDLINGDIGVIRLAGLKIMTS